MQSFLWETMAYKMVNIDNKQHSSSWSISAVSLAASIFVLIIIIWLVIGKGKCFLTQIIGERKTTRYDLKGLNVKQAPTNGEQVEMSIFSEEGNVNNVFEGKQNAFRRTDAAMTWVQN